jgi:hypothetical protein
LLTAGGIELGTPGNVSSKIISGTAACNIQNTKFDNVKEMSKNFVINRGTFFEMGDAEMETARHHARLTTT